MWFGRMKLSYITNMKAAYLNKVLSKQCLQCKIILLRSVKYLGKAVLNITKYLKHFLAYWRPIKAIFYLTHSASQLANITLTSKRNSKVRNLEGIFTVQQHDKQDLL